MSLVQGLSRKVFTMWQQVIPFLKANGTGIQNNITLYSQVLHSPINVQNYNINFGQLLKYFHKITAGQVNLYNRENSL